MFAVFGSKNHFGDLFVRVLKAQPLWDVGHLTAPQLRRSTPNAGHHVCANNHMNANITYQRGFKIM